MKSEQLVIIASLQLKAAGMASPVPCQPHYLLILLKCTGKRNYLDYIFWDFIAANRYI